MVEVEAENIRKSIVTALQKMTQFMESMRDTAHRIGMFALLILTLCLESFSFLLKIIIVNAEIRPANLCI